MDGSSSLSRSQALDMPVEFVVPASRGFLTIGVVTEGIARVVSLGGGINSRPWKTPKALIGLMDRAKSADGIFEVSWDKLQFSCKMKTSRPNHWAILQAPALAMILVRSCFDSPLFMAMIVGADKLSFGIFTND